MDDCLCAVKGVSRDFPLPNETPRPVIEDINLAIRPNVLSRSSGHPDAASSPSYGLWRASSIDARRSHLPRSNPPRTQPRRGHGVSKLRALPLDDRDGQHRDRSPRREVSARRGSESGAQSHPHGWTCRLRGSLSTRAIGWNEAACRTARAFSMNPEMLFMDEPFSQWRPPQRAFALKCSICGP